MYRSKLERAEKVKADKSNWFRAEGATATITIPATRNSELAKNIREKLIGTGPRGTQVKVIEKPGPLIMSHLSRNNPFQRSSCGRPRCPLILGESKCNEDCYREGVIYSATCNRCYQTKIDAGLDPKPRVYIGETSRTLYTRAQQHLQDYRKACYEGQGRHQNHSEEEDSKSSWMWDHSTEIHGGLMNLEKDYTFSVISSHKDPLTRQTAEAIRIQKALQKGTHYSRNGKPVQVISLNRKGEHFAPMERWNHDQ